MNYLKIFYLSNILDIAGQYPYFIIERTEEVLKIISQENLTQLKTLYKSKNKNELIRQCKIIENAVVNFKMDKTIESLKKLQTLDFLDDQSIDWEINEIIREKNKFINEIDDYKKIKNINS